MSTPTEASNPILDREKAIHAAREAKARKLVDEVIRQAIETLQKLSDDEWIIL